MKDYKVKKLDIDTGKYEIMINLEEARDLGVYKDDRLKVVGRKKTITAKVNITDSLMGKGEVGVFKKASCALDLDDEDMVSLRITSKPASVDFIRKKIEGAELIESELRVIIDDITSNSLSDIELAAYVTACYTRGMTMNETEHLTRAMIDSGEILEFDEGPVLDYHSIGGLPGNKITLLIVPIVAAAGLMIPKTCSRAISSACGTADILETIANVSLSLEEIKRITERVGGTIAWGGAVNIAPADDLIIQAEYPLSMDPYPQVIASIMSKKKAGGADYLLLDIPMGAGTKVEKEETARRYAADFVDIGHRLGMKVECAITFGDQPIGSAVGPALEVKEALMAMEGKPVRTSFTEKSTSLAGMILEAGGVATRGEGKAMARELLSSGAALDKFKEILKYQGGAGDITSESVPTGKYSHDVLAHEEGYVNSINNRGVTKIVRAAGAPKDKGGGLWIFMKKGEQVKKGEKIYTIYADNERKLQEAVNVSRKLRPVKIRGMILELYPSVKYGL